MMPFREKGSQPYSMTPTWVCKILTQIGLKMELFENERKGTIRRRERETILDAGMIDSNHAITTETRSYHDSRNSKSFTQDYPQELERDFLHIIKCQTVLGNNNNNELNSSYPKLEKSNKRPPPRETKEVSNQRNWETDNLAGAWAPEFSTR